MLYPPNAIIMSSHGHYARYVVCVIPETVTKFGLLAVPDKVQDAKSPPQGSHYHSSICSVHMTGNARDANN